MKTKCPRCEELLEGDTSLAGKTVKCPTCSHEFQASPVIEPGGPSQCPNCEASLNEGFMKSNSIFKQQQTSIINKYTENDSDCYCNKCGDAFLRKVQSHIKKEIDSTSSLLRNYTGNIVILTTHTPVNWDYVSLGMITSQTTTGTGVISEFRSGFTDFFGAQSGAYNKKLSNGEKRCMDQLRMKTAALHGNAVIAADIDYAEVGGGRGMLMVCIAGTAVRLKNTDVLGEGKSEKLKEMNQLVDKLYNLKSDLRGSS